MFPRIAALSMLVLSTSAVQASAQVCFGGAPFTRAPLRIAGLFSVDKDATTFGAQLLAGNGRTGLFGGGTVSLQSVDGFDGTGTAVEGIVGMDIATDAAKRVYVCPFGGAVAQSGPDLGSSDLSLRGWSAGGNAGFILYESARGARTIVTGGLIAAHQRVTLDASDGETQDTDTFGAVRVGVGYVLNKVSIIPILQFPFALDGPGASVVYGISVGFIF